jgi:hypothetical protein
MQTTLPFEKIAVFEATFAHAQSFDIRPFEEVISAQD